MSIYRGNVLIAAGGRDVNPSSILNGCNICNETTPDGNCVTINVIDCPTFCEVGTECISATCETATFDLSVTNNATIAGCLLDTNGCCYLKEYVASPGCPDQKICCLSEAQYQALVTAGTVDPDTYYYTPGESTVVSSDYSGFCAGEGIILTCSGNEMEISTNALDCLVGCCGTIICHNGTKWYLCQEESRFSTVSPPGTIMAYMGTSIPNGWMLADGRCLSRTDYAELFAAIGTRYGAGDGSTTFQIPDLRGEFLRGSGNNSHTFNGCPTGNGLEVGCHQNPTYMPVTYMGCWGANDSWMFSRWPADKCNQEPWFYDALWVVGANCSKYGGIAVTREPGCVSPNPEGIGWATRPTNTSVNYIISTGKFYAASMPTTTEQPYYVCWREGTVHYGCAYCCCLTDLIPGIYISTLCAGYGEFNLGYCIYNYSNVGMGDTSVASWKGANYGTQIHVITSTNFNMCVRLGNVSDEQNLIATCPSWANCTRGGFTVRFARISALPT